MGVSIETSGKCQDMPRPPRTNQDFTGLLARLGGLVAEERRDLALGQIAASAKYPAEPGTQPAVTPPQHPIMLEVLLHPDGNGPIAKSFRLPTAKV